MLRYHENMSTYFYDEIVDHLSMWLDDHEGYNVYGADFRFDVTQNENMTGAWVIGTYAAQETIKAYWDEASNTFDYFKNELDMAINPFESPEAFTFYMLDWGVGEVLAGNAFLDEHWDEYIELTPENIAAIKADF